MYALGLTTRQIQDHLKDIYAVDVLPELISRVADEVKELAAEWRGRPLEPFYPVVFLDALRVNIRDEGTVVKKSVYLAPAIRMDGQKELGGTKFRMGCGSSKTRGRRTLVRVLDEHYERTEKQGSSRHPPGGSRRADRFSRGHRRRVPQNRSTTVHSPHGP
jgi:hypothetical protein